MADVLAIIPRSLADGFVLAGARVWAADGVEAARDLLIEALEDPDAGLVALADGYLAALDPRTRRLVEQRARPLVFSLPTGEIGTAGRRGDYLAELIRRAVGVRLVLGTGEP